MWGDESEAVAPIIWLYQIVDAQKEDVFFPDILITLRNYEQRDHSFNITHNGIKHMHIDLWYCLSISNQAFR